MKSLFFTLFIITFSLVGSHAAWATHDLGILEKKIEQQKKQSTVKKPVTTSIKKTAPKITPKQTSKQVVPVTSKKNVIVKKPIVSPAKKITQVKSISTVKKPVAGTKEELSGEVVEVKTKPVTTTPEPKKEDTTKQLNEVKKQQEEITRATKQVFLEETVGNALFLKTQADVVMAKIQLDQRTPEYLENLRKKNGISDLQEQFKKLQDQIDGIEKDIRALPQNTLNLDISKSLSLQKMKFELLQKQESILQQIELKENFVKQFIESSKIEYDFNSKLYNLFAQKHIASQVLIKKLEQEINSLPKSEPQKQQNLKTT